MIRAIPLLFGALALLLAAGGASAATGTAAAGADGGRIVSIGGAVTEIVYALGAADRLVAVDSTSRYPPPARELPDVGYMRALAAEPILALDPALVLAVEDAGPPAVLDQLRAAGLPLVMVPDEPTPRGVRAKIAAVAAALGLEARGDALADRLESELACLSAGLARVSDRPKVLFVLATGSGAPLVAGRDTAAAGIIALAGGRNAIDSFAGYKPLSPEAAVTMAPELLLVAPRTVALLGGEKGLLAVPGLALTPAGRAGRVVEIDGLLLLGFGPRTGEAVRRLAGHLHPELRLCEAAAR